LKTLVQQLGMGVEQLVRQKEFNELGVEPPATEEDWLQLIAENPRILQRPIVVAGQKAALGRPPENVLAIL
jgi:arsenate reductase